MPLAYDSLFSLLLSSRVSSREQNSEYTTQQISDLSDKLESSESQLVRGGFLVGVDGSEKRSEDKLTKANRDSCKTTIEAIQGLMSQVVKDTLFNKVTRPA